MFTGLLQPCRDVVELPIVAATVEPQQNAYFSYNWVCFPFEGERTQRMSVLLYRPGYQTVEIAERPWWESIVSDQPEQVVWKKAADLTAQEEALKKVVVGDFDFGIRNRTMVELAAHEYARLAADPLTPWRLPALAETRTRLLAEAEKYAAQLRELDGAAENKDVKPVTSRDAGNTAGTR